MRARPWVPAILALALLATAGCLRPEPVEPRVAPLFTVETLDGGSFSIAAHRGEVVLLDFMATSCIPCRTQIPEFADVKARHAEAGLAALSVSVDPTEEAEELARFRAELGADWSFALDGAALRIHYRVLTLPKQVLVDRDGNVAWETAPGQVVDGERLAREVRRLL